MTARLVVAGTATRDEWLAARRQGVTASEIATVMGLNPWDSPYALFWRKRGDLPEQDDNEAMALGRYLEAYVAGLFAGRHPEFALTGDGSALWAHQDRPWQMATPDRLIDGCDLPDSMPHYCPMDPLAVLEAKTTASYDGWGDDGSDEIPVHYRCQVLWQMDVMGVSTGYVACLFLHSRRFRVYEITMDGQAKDDLELMRGEALDFLQRVATGTPPEPDWRPATTAALKRLHPDLEDREQVIPARMGRSWLAACGRVKSAEAAKRRLENQIRERLGAANRAVLKDGTKVATRRKYTVTEKKIRDPYEIDKLMPARQPKEQQ